MSVVLHVPPRMNFSSLSKEASCESSEGAATTATAASEPPKPPPRGRGKRKSRRSDWEILEGLKEGQTYDRVPKKFEGFVLKKRKWPLKGYHKV